MNTQPGMRALIVDDSATARMILAHTLKKFGFRVHQAESGVAAITFLLAHGEPDVALIDWNMPGLSGIDLVRRIKKDKLTDCPLMMVTSESALPFVQSALAEGADEFLMKPFEEDMLRDKLVLLGFSLRK